MGDVYTQQQYGTPAIQDAWAASGGTYGCTGLATGFPLKLNPGNRTSRMAVGGTPNNSDLNISCGAGADQLVILLQGHPASGAVWAGGTWTIRYTFDTNGNSFTMTGIWVCRINSSDVSVATMGANASLSQGIISAVPDATNVVTLSIAAQSPAPSDYFNIYLRVRNEDGASARTLTARFNNTVDTTITNPTGAGQRVCRRSRMRSLIGGLRT